MNASHTFGLSNQVITEIHAILKRYPAVKKAILYGSRAKGNYKNGSDIDLTLIGDELTNDDLRSIFGDLDDSFIPQTVDLSLFEHLENAKLREHIDRVGVLFYEKAEGVVIWKTVAIGDVCELYQPQTITTKDLLVDGKYPVYGANGIIGRYDKYNHEESQLLVTCRGATCGSVNVSQPFSWINGNAMVVKPKIKEIDIRFIEYFFRGAVDLTKAITGAAQPQITRQSLSPIKFSYPSLSTQEKIVVKLDAIFAEIDKATAATEANAKNAKLYIGKLSDEIIHEKLENYKELTLNDITEVITCGVAKRPEYVDSGIPFLSARNVKNGKMKWDRYEFVSEETHNTLSKYNKPKIGDILYSRVGAGFGDAAIIDKDIEFSIFVSLTLLKVKPVVLNEFLCYYLNSPFIKEVARKNITGTGVGNLNVGAVRLFNIKLPDLKTQNEIVKKLDYINQNGKILIDSYHKKLEQLSLFKNSILKQAFNGELVKE